MLLNRKRSTIWNHFTIKSSTIAQCSYCGHELSYSGGSTSNLLRHLKTKHITVAQTKSLKSQNNHTSDNEEYIDDSSNTPSVAFTSTSITTTSSTKLPETISPKENVKKIEYSQSLEPELEYGPSKSLEDNSLSPSKINTSRKTTKRKIKLQPSTPENKKTTREHEIGFVTSAMEQLREISSRASEVAINKHDSYDYFGMYIASMLRNIGSPKAIQLQQNITNLVTNAICQPEYITTDNSMSGTTS